MLNSLQLYNDWTNGRYLERVAILTNAPDDFEEVYNSLALGKSDERAYFFLVREMMYRELKAGDCPLCAFLKKLEDTEDSFDVDLLTIGAMSGATGAYISGKELNDPDTEELLYVSPYTWKEASQIICRYTGLPGDSPKVERLNLPEKSMHNEVSSDTLDRLREKMDDLEKRINDLLGRVRAAVAESASNDPTRNKED